VLICLFVLLSEWSRTRSPTHRDPLFYILSALYAFANLYCHTITHFVTLSFFSLLDYFKTKEFPPPRNWINFSLSPFALLIRESFSFINASSVKWIDCVAAPLHWKHYWDIFNLLIWITCVESIFSNLFCCILNFSSTQCSSDTNHEGPKHAGNFEFSLETTRQTQWIFR
jgi:hypothetical protein